VTAVEVRNLVAGYRPDADVLAGCDLFAAGGELTGIVGPPGAGKSTLLKAIFGQVRIGAGQVLLDGADVTGVESGRLVARGVRFVPRTGNVFTDLTVQENLEIGVFGRPRDFATRFAAVVDIFPGLAKHNKQKAGSLSRGERRTVALARALMTGPTVLLLDEPSAGLAPPGRDEVFRHAHRIGRSGVTVLLAERNARRCLPFCARVYALDRGRSIYRGAGPELVGDPSPER
jgi:branched-chain amino acid transport system ATP-binding protein